MKNKLRHLIVAANHALHGRVQLVCAANELVDLGEDWYEIGFGNYQHTAGLQIIERNDAADLAQQFNDQRSADPSWMAPFYIGHPDHPDREVREEWPDKEACGWIDQVEASFTGFRFHVKWTPKGSKLISDKAFRYFSPLFWLQPERVNGRRALRPKIFQSVGLTNTPNMPGCWIGNDALTNQGETTMNLLDRLKALINKEEIQTEDDIVNIFQKMVDALKKLRDAQKDKWAIEDVAYDVAENSQIIDHAVKLIDDMDALVATANSVVPEATTQQLADLQAEVETQKGLVVAANQAAANQFADMAISLGKLKPADKETKIEELTQAADLVVAGNTLLAGATVMKTASKTITLKLADMTPSARREARTVAANSVSSAHPGLSSVQVWAKIQSMDEYAHLFPSAGDSAE